MSAKRAVAVDPIALAIYDGIRSVMPVDVIGYMGRKRADEYAALWGMAAAKSVSKEIAEAEKRGAVKALRGYADTIEGGPWLPRRAEVADMRNVADRIESGEMAP